jgi:Bacterial regulatory protein, Fis family
MIPETDKTILGSLSRAARGGTLDPERLAHRAYEMGSANCHKAISRSFALPETLNLNDLEKAALEKALRVTGGSILAAAQLLGIGKTTAYRKVKQYGLATGSGAAFCPNCGRRLPRQNATTREVVSPSLAANSAFTESPAQQVAG